jgi:hypothetical protein
MKNVMVLALSCFATQIVELKWSKWEFLNMTNIWIEFLQNQGASWVLLNLKLGRRRAFLA